jgi:hypothetical protein
MVAGHGIAIRLFTGVDFKNISAKFTYVISIWGLLQNSNKICQAGNIADTPLAYALNKPGLGSF